MTLLARFRTKTLRRDVKFYSQKDPSLLLDLRQYTNGQKSEWHVGLVVLMMTVENAYDKRHPKFRS
jgi:hypothetical protein